ncbi:rhodanese-like domain-containing protein [Paenibacillus sp.]|jgi:rhodanese-related sulfurtransferase|uniref:rhodanese-like domain-containing protein n=1 Tax=Paenibacillus sp. TaxID=58172 RepID=UPI002818396E|nr:rhodanese-like domain-containing protein [Paenibacillus sp.]MDR0267146.1 rhodanese-like domain-containing protein [Paenibacillus sp.]
MLWFLLAVLTAAVVLWAIRKFSPVRGLTFISTEELCAREKDRHEMQMLDVRDAVDYIQHHVPGSINISMGRLPYVYQSQLASEEPVLILAENCRQTKKAARLLKRYGFLRLYAPQNGNAALNCNNCCCH